MTIHFKNELEKQLHAAQLGESPSEVFMQQLIASQVFMPVIDEPIIGGIQRSTSAQPLVVQDDSGINALVLFTSPDRAKPFLEDNYPEFNGGLLTEFTWILEKMDTGFGIMINPGDELGIDIEPELVRQLAQSATRTTKQPPAKAGGFGLRTESPDTRRLNDAS